MFRGSYLALLTARRDMDAFGGSLLLLFLLLRWRGHIVQRRVVLGDRGSVRVVVLRKREV